MGAKAPLAKLPTIEISTPAQFQQALQRFRSLDPASPDVPLGLERAALEVAISRFLADIDKAFCRR